MHFEKKYNKISFHEKHQWEQNTVQRERSTIQLLVKHTFKGIVEQRYHILIFSAEMTAKLILQTPLKLTNKREKVEPQDYRYFSPSCIHFLLIIYS